MKDKGLYCASLSDVLARFTRSMMLFSLLLNALNVIFTFLGPVSYIVDSAPSLGVYYFLSLTPSLCISVSPSVCLSVTLLLQIASFTQPPMRRMRICFTDVFFLSSVSFCFLLFPSVKKIPDNRSRESERLNGFS